MLDVSFHCPSSLPYAIHVTFQCLSECSREFTAQNNILEMFEPQFTVKALVDGRERWWKADCF